MGEGVGEGVGEGEGTRAAGFESGRSERRDFRLMVGQRRRGAGERLEAHGLPCEHPRPSASCAPSPPVRRPLPPTGRVEGREIKER